MLNYNLEQWTARVQMEDFARLQRYALQRYAYNGIFNYPDNTSDERDATTLNYIRPVVDISVQTLIGDGPKFTLSDEKAQETFDSFAKKVNLTAILRDLARNGAIFGHTFIKIVPERPFPRLLPIAPEFVYVVTDPHDYRKVLRYRIEYVAVDPDADETSGEMLTIRQDITLRDDGYWDIVDSMARGNKDFQRVNEEYSPVWPYPWSPVSGCPNLPFPNEYYGHSDIEDVLPLNNTLNLLATYLNRLVRIYSYPIVWGRGFSPKAIDEKNVTSGRLLVIPSASAEIDAVNINADINSILAAIELTRGAIYDIAQTPRVSMGLMEHTSVLSALSLQVLYGPLLYKIREKRTLYGAFFTDIVAHVMELMGFRNVEVAIEWPEVLPNDETQAHNVAIMRKNIGGISQQTILAGLGLDFDTEAQRIQREHEMMQNIADLAVNVGKEEPSPQGGGENAIQQ